MLSENREERGFIEEWGFSGILGEEKDWVGGQNEGGNFGQGGRI